MFVVINKPHGLLVHGTDTSDEYTLRDYLIESFDVHGIGENNREGIVHRLDKVTSGLIICPINLDAYNQLKDNFEKRKIKIYWYFFKHFNLTFLYFFPCSLVPFQLMQMPNL